MRASYRSAGVEYAIRDVVVPATELIKRGATITNFNIGDPNKYDFETPQHMIEALCAAARQHEMGYAASEGIPELREAILAFEHSAKGLDTTVDNIVVSDGVSEGIQMLMGATVNKGDEVLVPGPAYSPYTSQTKYFDGTPVVFNSIEEDNWACDIDDIRAKITDKTKALVLITPNNPPVPSCRNGTSRTSSTCVGNMTFTSSPTRFTTASSSRGASFPCNVQQGCACRPYQWILQAVSRPRLARRVHGVPGPRGQDDGYYRRGKKVRTAAYLFKHPLPARLHRGAQRTAGPHPRHGGEASAKTRLHVPAIQ